MSTLFMDIHYHGCTLAFVRVNGDQCSILSGRRIDFEQGNLNHIMTTGLIGFIESVVMEGCTERTPSDAPPLSSISHIITTVGPASFTALRSGLSCIQGIARGLMCPVFTLTRLQALALDVLYHNENKVGADNDDVAIRLSNNRGGFFYEVFGYQDDNLISRGGMRLIEDMSTVAQNYSTCIEDIDDEPRFIQSVARYAHGVRDTSNTPGDFLKWGGAGSVRPLYGHEPQFKKRTSALKGVI